MSSTDTDHSVRNLAARMGRWSAAHWKTATFGWLAFVVLAFGVGGMVGTKTIDPNTAGPGESGRADRILDAGFQQPAGESVLIQSTLARGRRSCVHGPRSRTSSRASPGWEPSRTSARRSLPRTRGQISRDRHAALVEFEIRGDADTQATRSSRSSTASTQRSSPPGALHRRSSATRARSHAVDTLFAEDLEKAGLFSLPITLVILVLAFGALVAAGIPLLLALTAVFATFGMVALPSHLMPVAEEAAALVLLIGLAVGVDYSMFYLRREREERAAGQQRAGGARGRRRDVRPLGAHLRTDRDRGDGRPVPDRGRDLRLVRTRNDPRRRDRDARLADRPAGAALEARRQGRPRARPVRRPAPPRQRRRPVLGRDHRPRPAPSGAVVVLAGGLLLALAAPALQLRIVAPGPETFPQSLPMVKTYNRMQESFPGTALPADVVVQAPDVNAPAVREAIERLEQRALATGRMHEPITVDVNEDGDGREHHDPGRGQGHRRGLDRGAHHPPRDDRARDGGRAPGRRDRRHGHERAVEGLRPTR